MRKLSLLLAASVVAVSAFADNANEGAVENYMRNSIYTIILKSEKQNNHFEEETKKYENQDGIMAMAKSLAGTDKKKAANDNNTGSLFDLPAQVFQTIAIPEQFNDHNLEVRVLDFDALRAKVTDDELAKYGAKKKGGLGAFAKGMAGMDTTGDNINAEFDQYVPAVLHKFFAENHIGENLIAKWYDYDPSRESKWTENIVKERGDYNFTDADRKMAADDPALLRKIAQTGTDMIGNTYVLAVNLRFRSYQAIVAEAAALAKSAGSMFGGIGSAVASVGSTIASAAAGDGYTVQAITNLYKLKWNEDINQEFGDKIFFKNASLEDLVAANMCELEHVGTEKSSSNIRQSLFSEKPISDLVKRATARAIDESICKLQGKVESFRTAMPVIGGDGNGTIYARIGTKEGLNEKDEYELLEKQEDKNGKTVYKSLGSLKPVKGKIWNNAYGAEEELAENDKATDADREAVSRGYSEFKGKKGDYKGYYIRLKKKK